MQSYTVDRTCDFYVTLRRAVGYSKMLKQIHANPILFLENVK